MTHTEQPTQSSLTRSSREIARRTALRGLLRALTPFYSAGATRQRVVLASPVTAGDKLLLLLLLLPPPLPSPLGPPLGRMFL
jgi:hypothetical protein